MPLEHRLTEEEIAKVVPGDKLVLCKRPDRAGPTTRHYASVSKNEGGELHVVYTTEFLKRFKGSPRQPIFSWLMASRGRKHATIDNHNIWLEGFEPWEMNAAGEPILTMFPYYEETN